MSFIYKNPNIGNTLTQPSVVVRTSVIGTNYSVLETGGYREVWGLKDLNFQTFGGSGTIENSGNTIPINYSKSNLGFIPSKVIIDEDGISSGRRRLGMQVYVHETNLVYQYVIDNYEQLFNAASGSTQEVASKYVISDNTAFGLTFVNEWLDSSIEGVSGVTRANARWKIFYGTDITVTGGTYSSGTGVAQFKNSTGGTFNVTGFASGGGTPAGADTEVQYNNSGAFGAGSFFTTNKSSKIDVTYELGLIGDGTNQGLLKLYCEAGTPHYVGLKGPNHSGGSSYTLQLPNTLPAVTNQILESDASGTLSWINTPSGGSYISWFAEGDNQTPAVPIDVVDTFTLKFTGAITSGGAGIVTDSAISANEMTIALINNGGSPTDKTFYRGDGEWQSPTDTELTGGTYNNGTGTVELKNSDGSVVTLTGFTTGTTEDTYVTGMSYSQVTKALTLGLNDGVDFTANGFAAEVTGGIYNIGGTITLNNNDGTTSTITGLGAINTNIYTDDGTLQGDRVVDQDTRHLTFSGGTGVSMGTGTTSPVCALLELASENQGLLIPRMTQAQRLNVSTPKPGLLLYCLDSTGDGEEGLYMYKSIGWVNVL